MPAEQPFTPVIASTTGFSVSISSISTQSTASSFTAIDASGPSALAETVLVTNTGAVTLYVRMSREATPVCTSLDIPIPPNSSRVFGNPNPNGTTGCASTGVGFGNGVVIFTPGNSGE